VAKVGVNYPFVLWSKKHVTPTPATTALERKIISLRTQLVESLIKLIAKQSVAFALGSKSKASTVFDLISLGTLGALTATDKYTPEGAVSARAWKSVVLGRISEQHLTHAKTALHLVPADARRLAALRAGRVPEDEITDDDLQLQQIDFTSSIRTVSVHDEDEGHAGVDAIDPGLNPEEAMIAREEEAERERALAEYRARKKADRGV
jgi:hypothetical protein